MAETTPLEKTNRSKVLIVDDEMVVRRLLTKALGREDKYDVREATNGAEALGLLESEHVDVVITDLVMPKMGGLELIAWGKKNMPPPSGPTWIILTGQGAVEDAARAVRLGAFDFVVKSPDMVDSLVVTVRNAVRERQQEKRTQKLQAQVEEQNERLKQQVEQLGKACNLLCEQAETIEEDFRRAAAIQEALLPHKLPTVKGHGVDVFYQRCHSVGGDLFDALQLDDRNLALYVADAAGHGVAAAMLAVVFKCRLHPWDPDTSSPKPPVEVLRESNLSLLDECRALGLFLSVAYCLLNTETGRVTIASAGHPPVLFHHRSGEVQKVRHSGPALGLFDDARYEQATLKLGAGDRMLFYTDGVCKVGGENPTICADELSTILSSSELDGMDLLRHLADTSAERRHGRSAEDDMTMLLVSAAEVESFADVRRQEQATAPPSTKEAAAGLDVTVGQTSDQTTVFQLHGRADWTYAGAFYEAAERTLAKGRPLAIDLTNCVHLDSTFLGTIHEIVAEAILDDVPIELYGLYTTVRSEFEELGMRDVLERTTSKTPPVVQNPVPLDQETDPRRSRLRVLRAHETLAGLNARSRQEFGKVVELLRREMGTEAEE
jgi:serine phosphatase RsbU (regulator of sigma subunit)/anti-anti-sigma regulatory factor